MKKIVYIFLLAICVMPFSIQAQIPVNDLQSLLEQTGQINSDSGLPYGIEEQLLVDITPSHPRPNEDVTIKIKSNSTDLNKALITWRVNSEVKLKQVGATQLTFTLNELGDNKSVNIIIEKSDGTRIEKTYFIVPTEIDILYEADTYVPPFYKGKAWVTHQSDVRVVAFPRVIDDADRLIPPESFTYTWSIDGKVQQEQSGFGKNVFSYTSGLLANDTRITVEAEPREYRTTAKTSVIINPVEPKIVVYEKNPVYGTIFEQAINGTYVLNRSEITFESVPFFFTPANLNYNWIMNERQISSLQNPREITFRIEGEETGQSNVSIRINNNDKLLQSAATGFKLIFDKINDATQNAQL